MGASSAVPRSPRTACIHGAVPESEMDQCEFVSVGNSNEVACLLAYENRRADVSLCDNNPINEDACGRLCSKPVPCHAGCWLRFRAKRDVPVPRTPGQQLFFHSAGGQEQTRAEWPLWEKIQGSPAPQTGGNCGKSSLLSWLLLF